MASDSALNDQIQKAAAATTADSTPHADNGSVGQPTPSSTEGTSTPTTKSAAKKAAKAAEKAAKVAVKQAARDASAPKAGGGKKKEKEKKEAVPEVDDWVDPTKPGEKKDLSLPMEAAYNPLHVESSWFQWWEKSNFFAPQDPPPRPDNGKLGQSNSENTFVIPAPPPNVTGNLHIGHALTIAIQDTLVRWCRMRGMHVLFNPGYDHAGISTQSVVEKRLWKTEGKTRHDYGREAFLGKVWEWKHEYQSRIANQLRRLGASYDFNRERFTMDENLSKAVIETFCRLHEDGQLYRANRLVNWCVRLNTTLSNLEVEQKELPGRTLLNVPGYDASERIEFGVIVSFAYPIEGSDEKVIVATTRPETMLGDTAVAVHPDDPRYKHLHGKFVLHPFLDRRIPIITDDIAVDMSFGTGAVKITPAHDPNDYEVGVRHNLEFINILNDDGTFNENAGPYKGVKRFSARRQVIEALKQKGLYVETKDNPMNVPICVKSGDIIEPLMKPQWWVDCKGMAKESVKRARAGELTITPKQSEAEFYRWMENIQDWCVSRQLWWGHRCPAYFVDVEGEARDRADGKNWVVGRTLEQATERAEKLAGGKKFQLEQDEDVLDTWFSSGLWPFSIMGWPDKTSDLKNYYPSSVLETGWDILFFWVARMIMLGIKLTDQMPFREVFCHAMVRDAHGRKMSKSLGNVIDPIDVIEGISLEKLHQKLLEGNMDPKETTKAMTGQKKDFPSGIPQCGTDALRFTLCAYTSAGRDINLDILRVEGYRKFCNKLWNATRFALMKLDDGFEPPKDDSLTGKESLVEKWILHKLDAAAREINEALKERNFMSATSALYNYWLYELCDVYIEAIKPITDPSAPASQRKSAQDTLYNALDGGLRLLHPVMPYVTEELWQRLPRRPGDETQTIALAAYPTAREDRKNPEAEADFELVFSVVRTIRSMAAEYGLQSNLQMTIQTANPRLRELLSSQTATAAALIKGTKSIDVVADPSQVPDGCVVTTVGADISIYLLVRGLVNFDAEVKKLEKKIDLAKGSVAKSKGLLSKEGTPEDVKKATAEKVRNLEAEIETLNQAIQKFLTLKG